MQRHLTRFAVALWALALCATALAHGVQKPSPYRWVSPPIGSDPKQALGGATPGSGTVLIDSPEGVQSVATQDGQAAVSFTKGSILPKEGESEVSVTVTALDPMTFGPPPEGLIYDSNAYVVDTVYVHSGEQAQFAAGECPSKGSSLCPTLAMRYSSDTHGLFVRDGDTWIKMDTKTVDATYQVFTEVSGPGTFVAAGHRHQEAQAPVAGAKRGNPMNTGMIWASVAAAALILGALGFRRARR